MHTLHYIYIYIYREREREREREGLRLNWCWTGFPESNRKADSLLVRENTGPIKPILWHNLPSEK